MNFIAAFISALTLGLISVNVLVLALPIASDMESMGGTDTKKFYITKTISNFASALRHICPERHGMVLATVETPAEFKVLDSWYKKTYGNGSWENAWTSGFAMGAVPLTWATNGSPADLTNYVTSYPWRTGGWNGAMYSGNNCISIYRNCNRPKGSPPEGCWPARTEFYWSDCAMLNRVICQRTF